MPAASRRDESDSDEDDETDALLAELSAEASNTSRWCNTVRSADGNSTDNKKGRYAQMHGSRGAPSALDDEEDDFSDAKASQHAPFPASKPTTVSTKAPSRGMQLSSKRSLGDMDWSFAGEHAETLRNAQMKLTDASTEALDTLSTGMIPFRLMAWGVAFVVIFTLLAFVTTPTGRAMAVRERMKWLSWEGSGVDVETAAAATAATAGELLDLAPRSGGRGRVRGGAHGFAPMRDSNPPEGEGVDLSGTEAGKEIEASSDIQTG